MRNPNRPTILLVLDVGHIPKSSSTQRSKWPTCRGSHGCNSRRHIETVDFDGSVIVVVVVVVDISSASGMCVGNARIVLAQ